MYVEQKLVTCAGCGGSFVVQYACRPEPTPSRVTDVTTVLSVRCPYEGCRRPRCVSVAFRVADVVVKWAPFLAVDRQPA